MSRHSFMRRRIQSGNDDKKTMKLINDNAISKS
jgi:hypothetical protein